ncbi:hypothetical protein OG203_43380 [Nocardia sp. NBC_01499]|uniref:hypothetical protein n=1 Tax=Nocardia sp. NBC_01499 TaxID=2903597 RepID=UPI003866764B
MTVEEKAQTLMADAATLEECATRLAELGTRLQGSTGVSSEFCAFMTAYAARCRTAAKDLEQIVARLAGNTAVGQPTPVGPVPMPPGVQTLLQYSQMAVSRLPIPGKSFIVGRTPPKPEQR